MSSPLSKTALICSVILAVDVNSNDNDIDFAYSIMNINQRFYYQLLGHTTCCVLYLYNKAIMNADRLSFFIQEELKSLILNICPGTHFNI